MLPALTLLGLGLVLFARPILSQAGRLSGIPSQFYRIAINPALRRNHALEHATLNVLTERHGTPVLNGAAVDAGFVLRGWVNPSEVASAAQEGLHRLQAGETELAYHPRCGTSLATGELLTWSALLLALLYAGRLTVAAFLLIIGISWVLSPFAGKLVQRYLTTTPDARDLTIGGISFTPVTLRPRALAQGGPPGTVPGQVIVFVDGKGRERAAQARRRLPWAVIR